MSWDRLGSFCYRVLIPIVISTMPDENTTHLLQLPDQIFSFQATSSSETLRTQGMTPLVKSLYKSFKFSFSSSRVSPCVM